MHIALLVALLAATAPGAAPPPQGAARPLTLVVCAPGWPGTTAEAQPTLDALLAAVTEQARWPPEALTGVYLPDEAEGLARLARPDAALALVPYPFFAKHARALRLSPLLGVTRDGDDGPTETWSLVARKGRVSGPAALAGFTLRSTAGYAPGFVRSALVSWGALPEDLRVEATGQVLSALRQAASGAKVVVLLDEPQARALPSLPFAGELEVVAQSAPVPVALLAAVGERLPAGRRAPLEHALLTLPDAERGRAALAAMRLRGFAPLDAPTREAAHRAGGSAR